MIRVRILGSGTSSGVPRIGNDWGDCDPAEPRNRRRRASILIESTTTRILVDTSPDMREQLLDAEVSDVDAVIWTHDHADHCHGIDDLRQLYHVRGRPVSGFAAPSTLAPLTERFAYAFHGRNGYPATIDGQVLKQGCLIGDIMVDHVVQPHGGITSLGLRFTSRGKTIGYATDFDTFTDTMVDFYQQVDVLVVDALRHKPHPTHPHLALSLAAIARCRPGHAILSHMDQSMDYRTLAASLPRGVMPGFDGLMLTV